MKSQLQRQPTTTPAAEPAPRLLLQRRCACGGTPGFDGECAACRAKRLQRRATESAGPSGVPPIVHEVLRSPGQPLDAETRAFMEPRFGHDFSRVRVHTGARAAESARAVNALAYTVGRDVVFGAGQYAPGTSAGRRLLAHELAHVVQQDGSLNLVHEQIESDTPASPNEQHADALADTALFGGPRPAPRRGRPALARRGPMPVRPPPVRPPPVRAPATTPQGGTLAPGSSAPGGRTYQQPVWVPEQSDTSFDAALQRAAIRDYAERQRILQERPVATLDRDGQPPDFITEHGTRLHIWLGGPAGGGSVTVRNRRFHVLDAIEYAVGRANTEQDLAAILQRYIPVVGIFDQALDMARGRTIASFAPVITLAPTSWFDAPLYPTNFDPRSQARLQVYDAAVQRRAQAVPTLAQSRRAPQSRQPRGCAIEPIDPLGDDPLSSLYCDLATGSPFSYKITILSPTGARTQRWAEIDSLRGNTWYECKCGYEALLSGAARGEGVARSVLAKLDHQVLNHVDIARTCGLEYRYIVSSERVAETLRQRWFGNVVINVFPFEGCG